MEMCSSSKLWALFVWWAFICSCRAMEEEKPNIVIIMADDMGFDDVSFRGSNRFLTPNIDALAYNGIILNNLYVASMCTPSRAALLTGKYPINTGMQHYVVTNEQPWGLPLNETTMAEIFRRQGYHTSLFGKWHLGMSRKAYTPTMRGFDKHYGYLGAYIDYYDQTLYSPTKNYSRGHDFRNNLAVSHERIGAYVTDTLTDAAVDFIRAHNVHEKPIFMLLSHLAPHAANEEAPLQAPQEVIDKFTYIPNSDRRTYAAMMTVLDKSVGQVIDAITEKGILNNTIILFLSDNGGPSVSMHATKASNYPLRGIKNSPWEGALRSSAVIWSNKFEKLGTVWRQKFYIADFLPTLAAAANIELDQSLGIDGINLWSALKYGYQSVEREIVHNIDDIVDYVSYTKGKWKLVNGTTENAQYDGWFGSRPQNEDETDPRAVDYEACIRNTSVWLHLAALNANINRVNITQNRWNATVQCSDDAAGIRCDPLEAACLFDIDDDPCERNNVFAEYEKTSLVKEMLERIEHFRRNAHEPNNKAPDPLSDPKYYNNEWTWWQDVQEGNAAAATAVAKQYSIVGGFVVLAIIGHIGLY